MSATKREKRAKRGEWSAHDIRIPEGCRRAYEELRAEAKAEHHTPRKDTPDAE